MTAIAATVLAGLAGITALATARELLWPILFAVFVALLLSAPVEWLHRVRVPRTLAACLVMSAAAALIALLIDTTWEPGRAWFQDLPARLHTAETRIAPVRQMTARIDALAEGMKKMARTTPARTNVEVDYQSPSLALFAAVPLALVKMVTIFVTTLFFLASGPQLLGELGGGARRQSVQRQLQVVEEVRNQLGRYFGIKALINLGLGIATFGILVAFNVPDPLMWGCLAAGLNFVPYVGPAVMLSLIALTTLVSFPTLLPTVEVLGAMLILVTVESQIVQPFFIGKRLNVNPLVVFLAIWAGGWFWGLPGIFLATPVVISVKAAWTHVRPNGGSVS